MSRVLITGVAGFVGSHVALRYLSEGYELFGIDNLNPYYDPALKEGRLGFLRSFEKFHFDKVDIAQSKFLTEYANSIRPDVMIHLAAQAGVRHSIEFPQVHIDSNVTGFLNILEVARSLGVRHLVYASSSSVYGNGHTLPFSLDQRVDHPVSMYAATKRSNELMAHTYSHLYQLPTTGLRLFTVYGPWGRPDMAPFKFTQKIARGDSIDVYNHGKHKRDFTYIDDIAHSIYLIGTGKPPTPKVSEFTRAPYKIYNIGNGTPVELERFIHLLEDSLGRKAVKNYLDAQPGDVEATWADMSEFAKDYGFLPTTSIEYGVNRFVKWYREFYRV